MLAAQAHSASKLARFHSAIKARAITAAIRITQDYDYAENLPF
jgi:hypothetical protein